MLILAIEQSTCWSSAAILRDTEVLAARKWEETAMRNLRLFALLPEILAGSGVSFADIGLFAVGTGPGSFSGLRVAAAAAQSFALPGQKPVVGIVSAEALAWDVRQETGAARVTVVGDARRERLWIARFSADGQRLILSSPLALVESSELRTLLTEPGTVVSPDWDRIGAMLGERVPETQTLIRERRVPAAETVGRLAEAHHRAGLPLAPPNPIYLTPPVSVAPRFV